MPKKQKEKGKMIEQPKKPKRPKPREFMEIMDRLNLIDKEIKIEKELFDVKIKSLKLEKEYLWNIVQPKKNKILPSE